MKDFWKSVLKLALQIGYSKKQTEREKEFLRQVDELDLEKLIKESE
jgi:hypothetical protein